MVLSLEQRRKNVAHPPRHMRAHEADEISDRKPKAGAPLCLLANAYLTRTHAQGCAAAKAYSKNGKDKLLSKT